MEGRNADLLTQIAAARKGTPEETVKAAEAELKLLQVKISAKEPQDATNGTGNVKAADEAAENWKTITGLVYQNQEKLLALIIKDEAAFNDQDAAGEQGCPPGARLPVCLIYPTAIALESGSAAVKTARAVKTPEELVAGIKAIIGSSA